MGPHLFSLVASAASRRGQFSVLDSMKIGEALTCAWSCESSWFCQRIFETDPIYQVAWLRINFGTAGEDPNSEWATADMPEFWPVKTTYLCLGAVILAAWFRTQAFTPALCSQFSTAHPFGLCGTAQQNFASRSSGDLYA